MTLIQSIVFYRFLLLPCLYREGYGKDAGRISPIPPRIKQARDKKKLPGKPAACLEGKLYIISG